MTAQRRSKSEDDSYAPRAAARAGSAVFCFSIQAEADPGVMPRILELFAKRGLVPRRWMSDRVGPQRRELAIDLQVEDLTPSVADHIARCLRQVPCVSLVLTSEKLLGEKLLGEKLLGEKLVGEKLVDEKYAADKLLA